MREIIRNRRSVRNYTGEEIKSDDFKNIYEYINNKDNMIGINGNEIKVHIVKTVGDDSSRIGTYGVIKNAPNYIVVACENTKEAMVDCGYVIEKLVLFLESMDIGSCWLGGTYKKSQVKVDVEENEMIPIILPMGYKLSKKTFVESAIRTLAKSNSRIDFDLLFFKDNFNGKIDDVETREVLESVRLAPSASNKQPWRVVMDESGTAHFYLERTPNYIGGKLEYDIQMIDIGIAISHYEAERNNVTYESNDPDIDMLSDYTEYVMSVSLK